MQIIMMIAGVNQKSSMLDDFDRKKVVLGLSGGVDSTAACLMLQKRGFHVTGLYFNVLNSKCVNYEKNSEEGYTKARNAAEQLGIELICKDVSSSFESAVIDCFCSDYMNGRTPNPCIICNPEIKFKTLTDTANETGSYYIATGHYARTWQDPASGEWFVRKGFNLKKDQSYMLYRLSPGTVSRLILPLGDVDSKDLVREMTRTSGVSNSDDRDSQEICFIDKNDNYVDFMKRYNHVSSVGNFVDKEGTVLGRHKGISSYTIGQRKGLGIALGKPAFVTDIDSESGNITLGDNRDLFHTEIRSEDNILRIPSAFKNQSDTFNDSEFEISAKIRYGAVPAKATVHFENENTLLSVFEEPQRAPTQGQSIVFYVNDIVIGGGFIIK